MDELQFVADMISKLSGDALTGFIVFITVKYGASLLSIFCVFWGLGYITKTIVRAVSTFNKAHELVLKYRNKFGLGHGSLDEEDVGRVQVKLDAIISKMENAK